MTDDIYYIRARLNKCRNWEEGAKGRGLSPFPPSGKDVVNITLGIQIGDPPPLLICFRR